MFQNRKSLLTEPSAPEGAATGSAAPKSGEVGAVRVGAELRAARERLGWALPDVAAALRIRLPYLAALEEGRLDALPGRAYAVGFLRTYAASMGLEAEDLARRMKIEVATVHKPAVLAFPAPVPERGLPTGAVVLVGVILAIGAYVGWYRLSGEGRLPAEAVLAVPQRLAPLAQQAVPPSASLLPPPVAAVATPGTAQPAPDRPTGFPPSSAAAMSLPPAPAPLPGAATPDAFVPAPAPTPQIVLRAKGEAWTQVREDGGKVVFERVMKAGDTFTVPSGPGPMLLATRNAPNLQLLVNGTLAPPLANKTLTQRDLPLEADVIRAGRLGATDHPVSPAAARF